MKITLLTHFKEINKLSNTGRLVLEVLGDAAEQLRWDRLEPPAGLVAAIEAGGVALVYPGSADADNDDLSAVDHFILIDGTWHEARKIHQRSPYLQKARRVCLKPTGASQYNLRKNQKESCLCTAECVIEILRAKGEVEQAGRLQERFHGFIRPPGLMRGAKLKSGVAVCRIETSVQEVVLTRDAGC
jgi:DTW domain-containing protein YfiP